MPARGAQGGRPRRLEAPGRGAPAVGVRRGPDGRGRRSRRRHRLRADRRARTRRVAGPGRVRTRQARRHGQQGAARDARARALRRVRRQGPRPVLRGGGGRRDPADPAAQGVADRRAAPPGDGDRQRHDQLHPDEDVRGGSGVRRRARGREAARLRRGRPERGRRRARRGGQVRDPRVDRVQRAGRRERRVPRGHRERDPRGHRVRSAPRLRGEAARDRGDRGGRADRRPGARRDDPRVAPARLGARRLQRGLRRGSRASAS